MSLPDFSKKEGKIGLYSTLIFHLSLLIVLLITSIGATVRQESSFVLDFTKQEELEKIEHQEKLKEMVSAEVDEILSAALSGQRREVRNVAVNANENLRDDRNQTPSQVYEDARELQRKLDAAKDRSQALDEENEAYEASLNKKEDIETKTTAYRGPSVISYSLEGRKSQYLPVPAYRGYESGDVSVKVYVNNAGRVVDAEIIESISTKNTSLWEFALEAAKRSRFTSSSSAPKTQAGEIVYRFIGQNN